jgi:hypothetical protein
MDDWDEYKQREAREKHQELYWSEIEDGVATPHPRSIPPLRTTPMSEEYRTTFEKFERDLAELTERARLRGWLK